MGLIFYLSSHPSPIKVELFPYLDKLVHIVEYGVLASLVYRALRDTVVAPHHLFGLAFMIAFLYGVSDEIHQYFVPGREAELFDIVADGIGALCFPAAFQYYDGRSKARDSVKIT